MRIVRVHIENFRCLQDFTLIADERLNVLVGPNNAGKSAFLRALDHALGRSFQPFEIDDFFVAGPNVHPADLPTIRIDIEIRPDPGGAFTAAFATDFVGEIDFGANGAPFLIFRTEAMFDTTEARIVASFFAVKVNGVAQEMSARQRSVLRGYIPFYLADAFRDVLREFRERRGFWGRLIESIVLDEATRQAVLADIESINNTITGNVQRIQEIRARFAEIGQIIPIAAAPNDVTIYPVSVELDEVLRNLDVHLWTSGAPRAFSISRHGEGTRNIAHLVVFRTFVDLIAREENDNAEARPVLGIEEPEVHLHPHARRSMAASLTQNARQTFVSTHSAAIIREVAPFRIKLFRRSGGGCLVRQTPDTDPGNPGHPYFDARQLTIIGRLFRSGAAEALFGKCVVLFEGESEARAYPIFSLAVGVHLNVLGISLVSVDGGGFGSMVRLLHHPAFDIPWVVQSDAEDLLKLGRELRTAGVITAAQLAAAQAAGRIREDILEPNDWFALAAGFDFEKAMLAGGAAPEYQAAIATNIGPTALADFVAAQPALAAAPIEEKIHAFMGSNRGKRYKPLFAGIVADEITGHGTNPARIPQVFRDVIARAVEFANGARVKP